ncbi:hsp70-binding protein 1-like isoform X1 [Haliotis cracherodii]|uniref:hsp70-binding protein 1-like isoform X1 n=1 Tax=Haliotis cracherodii TaxID=6455 RepID=UPI0039ECD7AF
MAAPGDDGNGGPSRIPKDMKSLLQFCVQATQAEDPTTSADFSQMSDERKEWLEKALTDMSVNPVERMQLCVRVVKMEGDSDDGVEKKVTALEEITEWAEQIDFAIDFHKIGGFEILPVLLNSDVPELRWTCLDLIGTMTQNNPYCQAAVLEADLLPTLLQLLDSDLDPTVRTKALYAISCLSRENGEAQKVFVDKDGFSVLMRAMQADVEKLKIKSSFFLTHLCSNQPAYKDILCDIGMIDQLVGHLGEDHSQLHEHLMSALLMIVTDHSRAVAECRRPELQLHQLLKDRIQLVKDKEEFQEEEQYATQLLRIISEGDSTVDCGAR